MKLTNPLKKGLTLLAVIWLLFTVSLVIWWWIFVFFKTATIDPGSRRMILWEGGALVLVILAGGGALVYLTNNYERQHERMKLFFSTFAHDLKTSITRLRLQAELLQEQAAGGVDFQPMMGNIQSLDLQLENSLWMSSMGNDEFMLEKFSLSETLSSLRNEFPEVTFDLNADAQVHADRRALRVILRNLVHNSLLHGEASQVNVRVKRVSPSKIEIQVSDDGKGLKENIAALGQGPLQRENSKGNGIGLYLTRQLLRKMSGDLSFSNNSHFTNHILIPGETREAGR